MAPDFQYNCENLLQWTVHRYFIAPELLYCCKIPSVVYSRRYFIATEFLCCSENPMIHGPRFQNCCKRVQVLDLKQTTIIIANYHYSYSLALISHLAMVTNIVEFQGKLSVQACSWKPKPFMPGLAAFHFQCMAATKHAYSVCYSSMQTEMFFI